MITKLMQFVSQLFRLSPASSEGQPGRRIVTGSNGEIVYDSWQDRDRPLEQIINEGSHGKIEYVPNGYVKDEQLGLIQHETKAIKTVAEQDYEYLKKKLAARDLVAMSETRYNGLLKLAYINDEVNTWFNELHGKSDFILVTDVKNIGIVKG